MRTSSILAAFALLVTACGSGSPDVVSPPPPAPTDTGSTPPPPPAATGAPGSDAPAGACSTDEDCVPASCCHATACVPRAEAPDCHDQMCTTQCVDGTIDCGGGCYCQEGRCAAKLSGVATVQ